MRLIQCVALRRCRRSFLYFLTAQRARSRFSARATGYSAERSPLALLSFGLLPRSRSLCRLRSALAAGGMFPTLSLRIFLQMPDPMPRRFHEVHLPVSSFVSSAFPKSREGRLPASNPRTRLFVDRLFEAADIPLCSGLQICSPPRSFAPLAYSHRAAEALTSGQNVLRCLRTHRIY